MPENYIRKSNTTCYICNKSVYKRPNEIARGNVFCSRECVTVDQTILKTCPICQTQFRSGLNKNACSKACANKQRIGTKYIGDGDKKCQAKRVKRLKKMLIEAYGVKCTKCKYDNLNVLQVHHIIERKDGGTDDFENLDLLCPNCHMTIHHGDSRLLLADTERFELSERGSLALSASNGVH